MGCDIFSDDGKRKLTHEHLKGNGEIEKWM